MARGSQTSPALIPRRSATEGASAEHAVQRLRRRCARWWRGHVVRRRRGVALTAGLICAGASLLASTSTSDGTRVWVAARDLPAGTQVDAADLRESLFADSSVPDGLIDDPRGRTLTVEMRRGEPVTAPRVVAGTNGASSSRGVEGASTAVRIADADLAALLSVGDRVDLVTADAASSGVRVVAQGARVVSVPQSETSGAASRTGRLVVFAVAEEEAVTVAGISAQGEAVAPVWR